MLPRTLNGKRAYVGGRVVCSLNRMPHTIALFGFADSFEFQWRQGNAVSVTAVSMLGGNEMEIPLSEKGNSFQLDADLMKKLWKTDDKSAPAVLLTLRGN